MITQAWQPSNPPSRTPDYRLHIRSEFKKAESPAQEPVTSDDESNYYTAYATGLGWLPQPE